uniref:Uncharacterized protein n=1 Tax=Helianthus annuus TaxID=4232 RepID=A0A251VEL3_HELAN
MNSPGVARYDTRKDSVKLQCDQPCPSMFIIRVRFGSSKARMVTQSYHVTNTYRSWQHFNSQLIQLVRFESLGPKIVCPIIITVQ